MTATPRQYFNFTPYACTVIHSDYSVCVCTLASIHMCVRDVMCALDGRGRTGTRLAISLKPNNMTIKKVGTYIIIVCRYTLCYQAVLLEG